MTLNEIEGGQELMSFQDSLSVGDVDDFEDDDWSLSLTGGSSMTAFGIEIRLSDFEDDETLTLYSNGVAIATVPLNELPDADMIEPPLETVGPTNIGNYDRDRYADLMVKFSRQEVIRLLKVTDRRITISGELEDGTTFSGTDKIRVKCNNCNKKFIKKKNNKGKSKNKNKNKIKNKNKGKGKSK